MPDADLIYGKPSIAYEKEPITHKCTRCTWMGSNIQKFGGTKRKNCPECGIGKIYRMR